MLKLGWVFVPLVPFLQCLKNTEMPTTTIEAVLTSLANQPNEGLSKLCKISYAAVRLFVSRLWPCSR